MIFGFKDSLRQAVEAASGGLATVMYTPKGQPLFMRRINPFLLENLAPDGSLGTGWHPAFPNGRGFWVSIYFLHVRDNEPLSIPGVAPTFMSHSQWLQLPMPPGMRLLGIREYAAIALSGTKLLGDVLRGPDDRGRVSSHPWETGVRVDGLPPGDPGDTDPRVLTGSGPVTWRHDHSPFGGEMWLGKLFLADFRFRQGQFQLANEPRDPFASSNAGWMGIKPDGSLVSLPTSEPTLGYAPGNLISTERANSTFTYTFASLQPQTGQSIPPIVRALGLAPSLYTKGSGFLFYGNDNFLCASAAGTAPGSISGLGVPGEFTHAMLVYRE